MHLADQLRARILLLPLVAGPAELVIRPEALVRAVRAAARPMPDPDVAPDGRLPEQVVAELAKRVEQALRQEQSQWGQLTSQIQVGDREGG